MKLFHWLYCLCLLNVSSTYRILGIFPFPGGSHYKMFEILMKALAEKGHIVDVVSHFPQQKQISRFNDISIRGSMDLCVNHAPVALVRDELKTPFDNVKFMLYNIGLDMCRRTFNTTILKEMRYSSEKYDLVLIELFASDCLLGFGHILNVPVVTITTSVSLPWGNDRIGNPDNPSYIPSYFTPYNNRMTFLERLDNCISLIISKICYWFAAIYSNRMTRSFFGNDLPSQGDLAANVSLMLINSHFSINNGRPSVPGFIEVGGLHIQNPKPLGKHFEDLMNITETPEYMGVIIFTLGSMILTETLPPDKLTGLLDAFKELPYKVLWKATKDKLPVGLSVPKNIHFETWIPQSDILCHPNLKLFITHGGLLGLQEAIFCGVPCIGIPLFADQALNLNALKAKGVALMIDFEDISGESMVNAALEILNNPRYKENAESISRQFKDRPMSPLDTAIYWIEYVIRHNGAPHLRTRGADMPWYQYFLIDVAAFVICILGIFIFIFYITVQSIVTWAFGTTMAKLKKC